MTENKELAEILRGCKDGDAQSFSQLVDIYASRCYGYFYRLTGNRDVSDDLLSELFIKLIEKINTYKGGSFESWLFKTASNIFNDYLRSKQRQAKLLENQEGHFEVKLQETSQSETERFDKLQKELGKLDAETKELIVLRFYSQLSFREIAEMRHEPIGTTLSKLHRGLKRLRELVE